jgi:hypothetical protein
LISAVSSSSGREKKTTATACLGGMPVNQFGPEIDPVLQDKVDKKLFKTNFIKLFCPAFHCVQTRRAGTGACGTSLVIKCVIGGIFNKVGEREGYKKVSLKKMTLYKFLSGHHLANL